MRGKTLLMLIATACRPDDASPVDSNESCVEIEYFADADGDGAGDAAVPTSACARPAGYAELANDCDDNDAAVHPGAVDECDGRDEDCDGAVDEDATLGVWYVDADGDGFGDDAGAATACAQPHGYIPTGGDCDDSDPTIHPSAVEICDHVDDDCDGLVDADDPDLPKGEDCVLTFDDALVIEGYAHGTVDQTPNIGYVAAFGDLDGDDTTDLAVASYGMTTAYLVYGPATATISLANQTKVDLPTSYLYGDSLAVGDTNDDDFADLLVGDSSHEKAYLFLGPVTADRGASSADARLRNSRRSSGELGDGVDVVPDADGDGEADLVITDPFDAVDSYIGLVYVLKSSVSGSVDVPSVASYVYGVALKNDVIGITTADLGDVDGDGIDELAIAACQMADGGGIAILQGGLAPGSYDVLETAAALVINDDTSTLFWKIASADYDGDGREDVLAAAPPRPSGTGSVYGFLAPMSGALDTTDASVTWRPSGADDYFGTSVAAGDVDGDGATDVLLGDVFEGGTDWAGDGGAVYLQVGPASGVIDPASLVTINGGPGAEHPGSFVGFLPDWDGDGGDEVVIGALFADRGLTEGAFFVLSSDAVYRSGALW